MVLYEDVWLSRQTGDLGCKKRLDRSAIEERFANCMEIIEDGQCVAICSVARG